MRRGWFSIAIVLTVLACIGCTPQPAQTAVPSQRASADPTAPAVTAYPQADNTLADLDGARAFVVKRRPQDDVTAAELEGDLGRYTFYYPLDREWFSQHGQKPYKQVILHKDLDDNRHRLYTLLKATADADWEITYDGIGMGRFETPAQ